MVARKWRSGNWEVGVSFWSNREFLELDIGDYCTSLKKKKNTKLYTLNFLGVNLHFANFISKKKKRVIQATCRSYKGDIHSLSLSFSSLAGKQMCW